MDIDTTVDIDALQAKIVADIRAQFPALVTVDFFYDDRKAPPRPACLLEFGDFEPSAEGNDPGTGQLSIDVRFAATMIIDGIDIQPAKKSIRRLVTAFIGWLHNRRFPPHVTGPSIFLNASKDDFNPTLDAYECWRIEWLMTIHVGTTNVDNSGNTPTPLYSWSPDIGFGHEGDYTSLPLPGGAP